MRIIQLIENAKFGANQYYQNIETPVLITTKAAKNYPRIIFLRKIHIAMEAYGADRHTKVKIREINIKILLFLVEGKNCLYQYQLVLPGPRNTNKRHVSSYFLPQQGQHLPLEFLIQVLR